MDVLDPTHSSAVGDLWAEEYGYFSLVFSVSYPLGKKVA